MDQSGELQATMQMVEQACTAIQMQINPSAAEASLLAFRQSPHPYKACQYILENSQMAIARFQAAAALQEAALREWNILSVNDKNGLWMYCLQYAMACADASDAYVQVKVSAVAAVLLKRGWHEFTDNDKEIFFSKIKEAIVGGHSLSVKCIGITFLESVVSEFSVTTATAMGLPTEFHLQSYVSFQSKYLQQLYGLAQEASLSVSDGVLKGSEMDIKVCSAALRLMCHILNWDFNNAICRTGTLLISGKGKRNTSEHSFVQPGPAWSGLLLSSQYVSWLLEFYSTLRKHMSRNWSWLDSPLAVSCRQLIVQLCGVTGSIFPADSGQSQKEHLQRLFSSVVQWIDPPDVEIAAIKSGKSESELIDSCRIFHSIVSLTSPYVFNELLCGYSRYSGTVEVLSFLTCEVIKAENGNENSDSVWRKEALDILLDTWVELLQPTDLSKQTLNSQLGTVAAVNVFKTMVEVELIAAEKSAYDDGDSNDELEAIITERDERLSAFALIARAASPTTIPLLASLFSEKCSLLHQIVNLHKDPIPILEGICWLLYICGHVLADSGYGETAMVPENIKKSFPNVPDPEHHPVLILSRNIIDFAAKCLDPSMREKIFSPRLMESIIWFLARWTGTYLMPPDFGHIRSCTPGQKVERHCSEQQGIKHILDVFGEEKYGKVILETIVHISNTALTAWPGEHKLQELTCFQLLPALVARRNVCKHLVTLDPWKQLVNAFASEKSLLQLPTRIQRSLAESLCHSASGMGSSDTANQFIKDLMGSVTNYLIELSQHVELLAFAQKPDIIFLVCSLLERLRGAARSTEPRNQKAIFEMGASVMQALIKVLEVYKNEPSVVYVVLKFTVDWVDGQLPFLEARETVILFNFCLEILQVYSKHNIGKVTLSTSRNWLNETETEKYKDLRALLQLLINLCSKDLVDFSSAVENEAENPDVAQVVYLGLHILTPLISLDLLKYPKLCHQYYSLLVHMLEVYPEKVANLSPEAFRQIVETLDFGLHHQDCEVVGMTMSALNALSSYHYQAIHKGQEGLGVHNTSFQDANGANKEGVLAHFLRSVLQFLLFHDYSNELVGTSADAFLPLILCETDLYQRIVHELVQNQQNVVFQSRLTMAFHALLTSNNMTFSLDRATRQRFRKNLHELLVEVRCILRTM